MNAPSLLKSLAVALAAMIVNVAASFLWVLIYSIAVAPGQSEAAYQAYAMQAAPWCSVIAGIPILFAAGWLLAKWLKASGWRAGVGAGIAYVVIDFAIIAASGALADLGGVVALSFVTKLGAAALGGVMRKPG